MNAYGVETTDGDRIALRTARWAGRQGKGEVPTEEASILSSCKGDKETGARRTEGQHQCFFCLLHHKSKRWGQVYESFPFMR